MVDPRLLCRRHLMGEHYESHLIVGSINKKKSIKGFVESGLIDTTMLRTRHSQLAAEMVRRGYNHNSELPQFVDPVVGYIDIAANLVELRTRCEDCRKLQHEHGVVNHVR